MADSDSPVGDNQETDAGAGLEFARQNLGSLALRAAFAHERITITRHGKPIAALVGLADLQRLRALDAA